MIGNSNTDTECDPDGAHVGKIAGMNLDFDLDLDPSLPREQQQMFGS